MPEHDGPEKNINEGRPRVRRPHMAWVTLAGTVVAGIAISANILGNRD